MIRSSRAYYSHQQLRQAEFTDTKLSQVIQFLLQKSLKDNRYQENFYPISRRSLFERALCFLSFFLFYFIIFFWKTSKRKEEGNRMLHFVSVFEKERLKGIYLFLYYKFFFGLLVFSFTIYVIRFKRTERNILRIKRAHCKTNTAVYLYDH